MQPVFTRTHLLTSKDHTDRFAAALAPMLRGGDALLLSGGLGAGKTHFARAVIRARLAAIGRVEDVPSPTFTLVQTYDAGNVEIWHSDLYRLTHPDEVHELGLEDAFTTAVCLVEWPDRLDDMTPPGALHLTFAMTETQGERRLTASSGDVEWETRFSAAWDSIKDD